MNVQTQDRSRNRREGASNSNLVAFRCDEELHREMEARAEEKSTSKSHVIREALRKDLET